MSLLSKYINRQLAAYQSELVQTHYQEVENMYRQIRGWRHDYRNHIQVLKSYAKDGDLAQISKYLDELDEDLSTVDTVIKTGNKMTDAILNSKISLAKSKHIPVVADAHVPVALKTSEMDLCIIIGNLFDNAIEASLQLPEEKRMMVLWLRFLTEINSNTKDIPSDLLNDPEIGKAVEELEISGFARGSPFGGAGERMRD